MALSQTPFQRYGHFNPPEDARARIHVWDEGDEMAGLSGLAHRFYNDLSKWRLIADRNGIVDVRRIEAGTRLVIPELPLERGRYELA